MQLGATFVIAKGGAVVMEHRQQHFGDFPVLDDVCSAVTSMVEADDLPKLNLIVDATKRRKGGRRRAPRDPAAGSGTLSPRDSDDGSADSTRRGSTLTSPRSTSPSPIPSQTENLLSALAELDAHEGQTASRTRPARNPWTSQTVAEAQACKDCSPSQAQLVEDDAIPLTLPMASSSPTARVRSSRRPIRPRSRTHEVALEGLG